MKVKRRAWQRVCSVLVSALLDIEAGSIALPAFASDDPAAPVNPPSSVLKAPAQPTTLEEMRTARPVRLPVVNHSPEDDAELDAPSVGALALDCQGQPNGTLCSKSFLRGFFDDAPAAQCQDSQCVRVNAPEAIYAYPWQEISISVDDEPQLRSALAQVEANPAGLHTIFLSPGTYDLGSELKLTKGNVILRGNPKHPEAVTIQPAGVGTRLILVNGVGQAQMPLLALNGVTLLGGSVGPEREGAGIFALNAGLIIENSVVSGNEAGGVVGISVSKGFFSMDKSEVSGNIGRLVKEGFCGEGQFTTGGGIGLHLMEEAYILNSSIHGNKQCRAGGILTIGTRLHMERSTVSQNEGQVWGGGITAMGDGVLGLKFNTIAENVVGTRRSTNQPNAGAGIALVDFRGQLSLIGNIVANNVNQNANTAGVGRTPDDFYAFTPVRPNHTLAPPFPFTVTRSRLNNIKNWTMPQSPAETGIDDPLIDKDPVLEPLAFNGNAVGFPQQFTYLPAKFTEVYYAYTPDPADATSRTAIPTHDQRGFTRASTTAATPGAVDPEATKTLPPPVVFEAESGQPTAPLQIFTNDPLASGGSYVQVRPGTPRRDQPPTDNNGLMTFTFQVPESGTYKVWARVIIPGTNSDSFWASVDNQPFILWNNIAAGNNWHWVELHDSNKGNQVVLFDLNEEFLHTLVISYREAGARIDRLLITEDISFVPTGLSP